MTSWKGDTEEDLALLERLRKGDRAAFEAIYRRYHARLYTLALRYLKNRADTEDALQQLFVKLWTAREALFITRNLSGYLYGMLKHQVLNQIRNNVNALQHNYRIVQKQPQYDDDLYTLAERSHRIELLGQAIATLPPQQRAVATMRCEGYSNQEIAARLNLSIHTVNTHYREYLKRLKSLLAGAANLLITLLLLIR